MLMSEHNTPVMYVDPKSNQTLQNRSDFLLLAYTNGGIDMV